MRPSSVLRDSSGPLIKSQQTSVKGQLDTSSGDEQEILDLGQYWRIVKDARWMIIAITAVIALLGAVALKQIKPVYQATTSVLIEYEQPNITGIKDIYGYDAVNKEYILTQHEILKSRSLAEEVVKQLDLVNHPLFNTGLIRENHWMEKLPYEKLEPLWPFEKSLRETITGGNSPLTDQQLFSQATSRLMSGLSVIPIRNTQIVRINFQSRDPEIAALICNTVADQFIERHLTSKLQLTEKATSWLGKSLDGLRDRLRDSENALQTFREKEKLVDVKGVKTLNARELSELTERFTEAQKERLKARNIFEQIYVLGPDPSYFHLTEIPAVANHSLVSALKKNLATSQSRVAELGKRYGPKHPKMIAAQAEFASAKEALQKQAQIVARGLQTDYKIALDNEVSIKSQLERAKSGLQAVNRKEFRLRELEREVETNRQLYEMFMTRAKETNEIIGLQAAHARVVDVALPPKGPIKPKKKMLMMVILVVGLFMGVGIAFLRNALDNTTKSINDIETRISLPVMGELPRVKQNKKQTAFEGFLSDSQSLFSECIRTLRTGLILADPDHPFKTIVITSSVPNEGKSTVALNLAEAFGQTEKVLLIDADMRRPSLARSLNLSPHAPGLTNFVAGTAGFKDCLHKIEGSDVDVLIAGQLPNNPLELLSSQRFQLTLYKLKHRYDRIIVDSSPTHLVSDAMLLASYADAVLYVVKAGSTPVPLIKNGIKRLREINAPVAGVVLNQTNPANQPHHHSKYSGYRYTKAKSAESSSKVAPTFNDEVEIVPG